MKKNLIKIAHTIYMLAIMTIIVTFMMAILGVSNNALPIFIAVIAIIVALFLDELGYGEK